MKFKFFDSKKAYLINSEMKKIGIVGSKQFNFNPSRVHFSILLIRIFNVEKKSNNDVNLNITTNHFFNVKLSYHLLPYY